LLDMVSLLLYPPVLEVGLSPHRQTEICCVRNKINTRLPFETIITYKYIRV
jgi:hypothetical protein